MRDVGAVRAVRLVGGLGGACVGWRCLIVGWMNYEIKYNNTTTI